MEINIFDVKFFEIVQKSHIFQKMENDEKKQIHLPIELFQFNSHSFIIKTSISMHMHVQFLSNFYILATNFKL